MVITWAVSVVLLSHPESASLLDSSFVCEERTPDVM